MCRHKKLTLQNMQLLQTDPALFPYTAGNSVGLDALNRPYDASVAELVRLYFEGAASYSLNATSANLADAALSQRNIIELSGASNSSLVAQDMLVQALVSRAESRLGEIAAIRAETLQRQEVQRVAILSTQSSTRKYNLVRCHPRLKLCCCGQQLTVCSNRQLCCTAYNSTFDFETCSTAHSLWLAC
jgi:hypothetical protein